MKRRELFVNLGVLITGLLIGSGPERVFAQGVLLGFAQEALLGVDVLTTACGPSTLITINTATGAGTAIGPIGGFPCVAALAFAPDGTLFGVSTGPALGGTGDLITIDPTTGVASAVGPVGFAVVDALAVASDGTIFAAVNPGTVTAGGPVLATIDPNTGAGTVIGPIGSFVEGLAFAPDGTLFGAADILFSGVAQTLITINTATGTGTVIGPIGFPDVDALSFTADGTLFGANLGTGTLFTTNTATGAGTAIGPIGFCCIVGLASPLVKLDHFKCYEAEGDPVNVTVNLEDQFGVEPDVLVGEPELFCNPVAKTVAGEVTEIGDDTAHLTGYGIEGDEVERQVIVNNQFGEQTVTVKEPGLLFVPSEKDDLPSDLNLGHFKCYEADGLAANVTVDLQDQFGPEPEILVGEPKLFCNPAVKNGTFPDDLINPEAHLTCYEIDDEEEVEEDVLVDNQFGVQELEVEEPELLCVPSEKVEVFEVEDDEDDDDD